jgi:hypothetical protein
MNNNNKPADLLTKYDDSCQQVLVQIYYVQYLLTYYPMLAIVYDRDAIMVIVNAANKKE